MAYPRVKMPVMRILALALIFASLGLRAQPLAPPVEERTLRGHLAFLSDDLLEGRGTGSRGGAVTVAYLESQLRALGLKPLDGKSFRQPVALEGLRTLKAQSRLVVQGPKGPLPLEWDLNAVVGTGQPRDEQQVSAELLFVGYGIAAPEERWDDYKGVDCRGKVLVMLVNDPPPTPAEENRFDGPAMTYYGRWAYKYEEAVRRGAAGVLLIHTDASATYPWSVVVNSQGGERFRLANQPGNPIEGWITEGMARRLFSSAGLDLDTLRERASQREFRPVELGLRLEGQLKVGVRRVQEFNVGGLLPGSDPAGREEAILYTAHWDHLGLADFDPKDPDKDRIYNGAVDNASGCAALLAMARAASAKPPRRSLAFLFVCAEEQGLLGSTHYARNPLWLGERTVMGLNLDSLNPFTPTRDMGVQGLQRTTAGPQVRAALAVMGLRLTEAAPDIGGGYFRSDHFSLVRVGIPAVNLQAGRDFTADTEALRKARAAFGRRYHQVDEAYDPNWDLKGMVQEAQFALELGYQLAESPERPRLLAGSSAK